jgi:hypothetical protein
VYKKLFKGTFNVSGMPFTMHTAAIHSDRAYYNFINQLVKKAKLPKHYLLFMFDGSIDNYYIEEVKR